MFTAEEKANMTAEHRAEYAKYVTPHMKTRLLYFVSIDTLVNTADQEHLNTIPLKNWDHWTTVLIPSNIALYKKVCTLKEAAKQLIEEYHEGNHEQT